MAVANSDRDHLLIHAGEWRNKGHVLNGNAKFGRVRTRGAMPEYGRTIRLGALAAGTLVAATCAPTPPPSVPVSVLRSALIGKSPDMVAACLGQPPLRAMRGNVALWTYPSASDQNAMTSVPVDPTLDNFQYTPFTGAPPDVGFGASEGPVPPNACLINVVFDAGRVGAVTYVGPHGQLLGTSPDCSAIALSCVH